MVMAYMLSQWTHKESGNTISAWMHSTVRIEDGKIRRIYHFQDNMAILGQMGFKVVPGNSDE